VRVGEREWQATGAGEDLLDRALIPRQKQRTSASQTAEPGGSHGSPGFDMAAYRRSLLTGQLSQVTAAALTAALASAFEDQSDLIQLEHGPAAQEQRADLRQYADWAMVDLYWRFADLVCEIGGAEEFLTRIGVQLPDELGAHVQRVPIDVQRLVALLLATCEYDLDDAEADELMLEVCARLVSVLMGCARAWEPRFPSLDSLLVIQLLSDLRSWANDPEGLGVWTDPEDAALITRFELPSDSRILVRASVFLDDIYSIVFEPTVPAPDLVEPDLF